MRNDQQETCTIRHCNILIPMPIWMFAPLHEQLVWNLHKSNWETEITLPYHHQIYDPHHPLKTLLIPLFIFTWMSCHTKTCFPCLGKTCCVCFPSQRTFHGYYHRTWQKDPCEALTGVSCFHDGSLVSKYAGQWRWQPMRMPV